MKCRREESPLIRGRMNRELSTNQERIVASRRHATSRHQLANCAAILIVLAAATVLSADDRGKPRGADRKAKNLEVTVLTPDGQPAAWAEGARAVPASQVFV